VIRRLASVAVAAAAIAGAGAAVVPQHAATLVVLGVATVAVVAAGFLLVLAGPLVSNRPEPWPAPGAATSPVPVLDPQGLRDARRDLAGRSDGGLPPAVHRRLRAAAERRLADLGLDLADERAPRLLGATAEVLAAAPATPTTAGHPLAAAVAAHRLLDDLDRLLPGGPR